MMQQQCKMYFWTRISKNRARGELGSNCYELPQKTNGENKGDYKDPGLNKRDLPSEKKQLVLWG